jgi:hypothetical protein
MDHALKCAMQEQAKAAVLDGKWEQLRFLGNRFERAGCYAEAWNALAERVEKHPLRPCRSGQGLKQSVTECSCCRGLVIWEMNYAFFVIWATSRPTPNG